jgi:uncharacterized protein YndB with AHSA1/START domain
MENDMQNAGTVLKQFYDAVKRRDMATARGYLADGMVFVGLFETYSNADSYIATFTQLMQIVTRLDVKTIVGEGDDAAIFMEIETTAPVPAITLVAEWHQIKNGKIVGAQSAFDGRPFAAMFAAPKDTPATQSAVTYDILHTVGINATAPSVYAALTTKAGLAGWWTEQVTGDPNAGGVLQFCFDSHGRNDMKVLELVQNRHIAWECVAGAPEWIATRITFDLKENDGETKVLFAQRGWREQVEFMHYCSTKWAVYLVGLKACLRPAKACHILAIHRSIEAFDCC